jgi:hypothetical protein
VNSVKIQEAFLACYFAVFLKTCLTWLWCWSVWQNVLLWAFWTLCVLSYLPSAMVHWDPTGMWWPCLCLSHSAFHSRPTEPSTGQGSHPGGPMWWAYCVMLVFSRASGQMNWVDLEPFFPLLCLFVYDKLSEDVWKVNVWIVHPYLINLLCSSAPSD